MDSILPARLLALVRPAFGLVLRRIRSLKRCVQACGCKIMTPRYACKMPSSCVSARRAKKTGKKKEAKPNQKPSQTSQKASQKASQKPSQTSQKPTKKASQGFLLQTAYLGVIILQPQRFRLRILQMLDGRVPGASQVE